MKLRAITSGIVYLLLGTLAYAACPALDGPDKTKLTDYVRKKYKLQANAQIEVSEVATISGTCYRKLQFQTQGAARPFKVQLVASPDFRFLTRELFDSRVDPVEEEKRQQQALLAGLTDGKFPAMGPKDAPVTMVIFSDFECPFCAQLEKSLKNDFLPNEGDKLRVIFRYFPLDGHPWARQAAEAAACAQAQGDKYFWNFHDYFFEHQREIRTENLSQKAAELGAGLNGFDRAAFATCVEQNKVATAIDRDVKFGEEAGVGSTPTVFVNGQRIAGFRPEQIRTLIQELGSR
jgi:protein-disulfide isomerase